MAFNPDGSDFVGLDSDVFGDGDSDTQALDVFIQQRLRGNQYYLNANRRSVSRSYFGTATKENNGTFNGERPFGCIRPGDFATIPFKLYRGLASVTLGGLIHCQTQNSGTDGVRYWLLVRDQFRRTLGVASGEIAIMPDGYEMEEITCTLNRPFDNAEGLGEIVFRIQSQDAGDSGANISIGDTQGLRWTAASSGFISNQDPGPQTGSPEVLYLQQDDAGTTVDIFGVDDSGSKSSNDILFPGRSYINSSALSTAFSFRYLSYLQVRSLYVRLQYVEDRFGRIGLGDLQARQTIKGPLAINQAEAINQYHRAPKLMSFGPGDYTDSTRQQGSWPTNYRLKWPIAVGDGTAQNIIDDTFMCINEDPTFEVIAYVIATVEIAGGVEPVQNELVKGESDWIFAIDIEQFDTADINWTTPISLGTASSTEQVTLFTTDWPKARFLRTKTILHDFSGTTGSPFAGNQSSNFNEWEFATKEGLLFEEDYRLITALRFTVSGSLSYSDTLTPIRFRMSAQYDDGTADHPALGGISAASVLNESLHLTLVGYSIFEVA